MLFASTGGVECHVAHAAEIMRGRMAEFIVLRNLR